VNTGDAHVKRPELRPTEGELSVMCGMVMLCPGYHRTTINSASFVELDYETINKFLSKIKVGQVYSLLVPVEL
jgi:hypothetical protein